MARHTMLLPSAYWRDGSSALRASKLGPKMENINIPAIPRDDDARLYPIFGVDRSTDFEGAQQNV